MAELDDFLFTQRRRQKTIPANIRQTIRTETTEAPIIMWWVARAEFPCPTVTVELSRGHKNEFGA